MHLICIKYYTIFPPDKKSSVHFSVIFHNQSCQKKQKKLNKNGILCAKNYCGFYKAKLIQIIMTFTEVV